MMLNINEGRLQALSSQFNIDPADLIGLLAALTSNSKQNETQEAAEQSIIERTAYEDDNRKYDPLCRGDVSCITSESDFEGDAIYRILYSGLYADYAGGVVARNMISDVEHKIEQKAKEIGKTDLLRFFRKKAKEKKKILKEEAEKERKKEFLASGVVGLTNFQNLPDDISNMYVGPEWSCSDDGIVYIPQNSSQLPATVCSHPVLATRIRRSITTGMEQVEIAYSKNNSWRKRVFDKSVIASNASITKLYDFGISVTSDNAKGMVKYFQNMIDETEKAGAMPVTKTTQQLGWMGDKNFFPYTECDGLEFEKDDDYPGMLEDMRGEHQHLQGGGGNLRGKGIGAEGTHHKTFADLGILQQRLQAGIVEVEEPGMVLHLHPTPYIIYTAVGLPLHMHPLAPYPRFRPLGIAAVGEIEIDVAGLAQERMAIALRRSLSFEEHGPQTLRPEGVAEPAEDGVHRPVVTHDAVGSRQPPQDEVLGREHCLGQTVETVICQCRHRLLLRQPENPLPGFRREGEECHIGRSLPQRGPQQGEQYLRLHIVVHARQFLFFTEVSEVSEVLGYLVLLDFLEVLEVLDLLDLLEILEVLEFLEILDFLDFL